MKANRFRWGVVGGANVHVLGDCASSEVGWEWAAVRRSTCQSLERPKKLCDFWVCSLIFNIILMPKWGFNYSKMAKYRFLIDSNTFLTILGTSKILSKSGPVTLPITVNLL